VTSQVTWDLLRLPRRTAFSASAVECMGNVQAGAGELLRQLHITFHDGGLGRRLHAAQPGETKVGPSFMEQRFGHARIFRMLNHGKIDLGKNSRSVSRITVS